MGKRAMAMILVLALAFSFTVFAAEKLDTRLEKVTLAVKKTLGIDDRYTSFHGEPWEYGPVSTWSLYWSGDDGAIQVVAGEDGKVLSYNFNAGNGYYVPPDGYFSPSFSEKDEAAQKIAQAFLSKVLDKNESALFEENSYDKWIRPAYSGGSTYLYGRLKINGLDSPIGVSMNIDRDNGIVTSFQRDDAYTPFVGSAPSAKPAVTAAQAAGKFAGVYELSLQYVWTGTGEAALRYVPVSNEGSFYVDAQTGELVNINDLYNRLAGGGTGSAESPMAESAAKDEAALSEAEQLGVDLLKTVKTAEELDKGLRAVTAFGLGSEFTLGRVSYSVDRWSDLDEQGQPTKVYASVNYRKAVKDEKGDRYVNKYFYLDAKTGEVLNLYTAYPYSYTAEIKLSEEKAREKAAEFLTAHQGDKFGKAALSEQQPVSIFEDRKSYGASFNYVQKVGEYFYYGNILSVGVSRVDGSIDSYSYSWDDSIAFTAPEKIVPMEKALEAYATAYEVKLQYLSVPRVNEVSADGKMIVPPDYSYTYALVLAYSLAAEDRAILGVDPGTGELLTQDYSVSKPQYAYTDLDGSYAKAQILKLAEAGIGLLGEEFKPTKKMTQVELIAFILSADGYSMDWENEDADWIYSTAYYRRLLTPAQREPKREVTRIEMIRMLLDMSGYGKTAVLSGIFNATFTDKASIAAGDLGYAAIAQGLGIVKGDEAGRLNPDRVVTRQEAAMMYFNFLSR